MIILLYQWQLQMLDSAHLANPDCNWWLKGDGCDVVGGLGESTRLVWGCWPQRWWGTTIVPVIPKPSRLHCLHDNHFWHNCQPIRKAQISCCKKKSSSWKVYVYLTVYTELIIVYICICIALKDAHRIYSQKLSEGKCRYNALFSAGWTVEELQKLMEQHQNITQCQCSSRLPRR